MPCSAAIARVLQCVADLGRLSSVAVTTASTVASLIVRGAPTRGRVFPTRVASAQIRFTYPFPGVGQDASGRTADQSDGRAAYPVPSPSLENATRSSSAGSHRVR